MPKMLNGLAKSVRELPEQDGHPCRGGGVLCVHVWVLEWQYPHQMAKSKGIRSPKHWNVSCVSSPWRFRMEEPLSLQLKEGYAGEASRVTR